MHLLVAHEKTWRDSFVQELGRSVAARIVKDYVCGTVYNLSDFKLKISPRNHFLLWIIIDEIYIPVPLPSKRDDISFSSSLVEMQI